MGGNRLRRRRRPSLCALVAMVFGCEMNWMWFFSFLYFLETRLSPRSNKGLKIGWGSVVDSSSSSSSSLSRSNSSLSVLFSYVSDKRESRSASLKKSSLWCSNHDVRM